MYTQPKIAIVADWLTNQGGAEKVIYDLHTIFPDAPIYTTVYNSEKLSQFKNAKIHTSFLQNLPFAKKFYQLYLALMPYAFESFDFSNYDIVISSSFACAKGIITKPETTHICYCHNPMRYIWDESHQYQAEHNFPWIVKILAKPFLHKLRLWDKLTADRVDYFISNSDFVGKRIQKYYKRTSTKIYPGISFPEIKPEIKTKKKDFYLAAGRLKPHKRFDLTIQAFNISQENLIIAGQGEDLERLKSLNTNPNTKFLGFVSDKKMSQLFSNAKAFIFPQAEDFGITPVEAQFFGCPVIAYAKGGALETVINNKTGIYLDKQTPEALNQAIKKLNSTKFNYQEIHQNSQKFSNQIFKQKILSYISANS
jgi:glycosyltransferase involved in cell wall biosynthesis